VAELEQVIVGGHRKAALQQAACLRLEELEPGRGHRRVSKAYS
jgi:hypothetical protein